MPLKLRRMRIACWLEPDIHDRLVVLAGEQEPGKYLADVIEQLTAEPFTTPIIILVDNEEMSVMRSRTRALLGEPNPADLEEQTILNIENMVSCDIFTAITEGQL